jgi:hypothetical protein
VVATTAAGARRLARFPGPRARLFLVWDLEWTRPGVRPYRDQWAAYGDPALTLLARSEDHARTVRSCWNRPAHVVGDLDLTRVLEVAARDLAERPHR